MKLKEYKFLVRFKDRTEREVVVRQCKNNYLDRDLAIAATKSRYKGQIISIKNASDKTIV